MHRFWHFTSSATAGNSRECRLEPSHQPYSFRVDPFVCWNSERVAAMLVQTPWPNCAATFCFRFHFDGFLMKNERKRRLVRLKRFTWLEYSRTYFNKWSKMKQIDIRFWAGISLNIVCSSTDNSFSLILLNLLNVSMNFRYNISVNSVSGSSRKNDLKIPVTEWMSTSLSNCSAS